MTTPDTKDPELIAAGLTEAERRDIMFAEPGGELGNYFIRRYRDGGKRAKAIHELGLTTIVWSGLMLNEIGLAVRRILQDQSHDR